jgi:uncharacterized membrane-anchored protein YitT (DUF2179 family)
MSREFSIFQHMNAFWTKIIERSLRKKNNKYSERKSFTPYELASGYREFKVSLRRNTKDFILITLGIFLASFGFKGFLLTNHFIDGGATGISLLISALTEIPLHILVIVVNIPFIVLAYRIFDRQFAVKASFAIAGLSIVLATVTFPNVTNDNLLVAIFGGFFLGGGIGMAIRGGTVIDGTEVLAIFLSRKFGTTIGDIILIINVLIFSAASYLLSIEIALYSMITYLSASKTLDFIVEGIEEYIGVTIVATHCEEIRYMIINKMERGVTVYKGKRGFGKSGESKDRDIIYTVITRLELSKLNAEIEKIEPTAFVVITRVKDTKNGMIKKRPLEH